MSDQPAPLLPVSNTEGIFHSQYGEKHPPNDIHSRTEVSFVIRMMNYRHHTHLYVCFEQINHVLYSDPVDHFTLLLTVTNVFCLERTIALYEEDMLY